MESVHGHCYLNLCLPYTNPKQINTLDIEQTKKILLTHIQTIVVGTIQLINLGLSFYIYMLANID